MRRILLRYLKFAGAGFVGTLVDTLLLWILSDHVFSGVYWKQYLLSPAISFQCAVIVNYLISYFYVWRDRRVEEGRVKAFFIRMLYYDLSCSTVFAIRLGILLLIERLTGWDVVICNLVAMLFSGIANFLMNNLVIFRNKTQ